MTCSDLNNMPVFKIGDTFNVPMRFFDQTSETGIVITSDMVIECKIADYLGNVFAIPEIIPYPDQINNAGFFLLKADSVTTSTWKSGIATLDVKLTIENTEVRHSQNFSFRIIKGIS